MEIVWQTSYSVVREGRYLREFLHILQVPFTPGVAARRLALVTQTFDGGGRLTSRNWVISSSTAWPEFCAIRFGSEQSASCRLTCG